jgi:hypothetical protein
LKREGDIEPARLAAHPAVIANAIEGRLTVPEAAERRPLSQRQVQRRQKKHAARSPAWAEPGNRGRRPAKALAESMRPPAGKLAAGKYAGFNDAHRHEKLTPAEGRKRSRPSVRRMLRQAKIASPPQRRPPVPVPAGAVGARGKELAGRRQPSGRAARARSRSNLVRGRGRCSQPRFRRPLSVGAGRGGGLPALIPPPRGTTRYSLKRVPGPARQPGRAMIRIGGAKSNWPEGRLPPRWAALWRNSAGPRSWRAQPRPKEVWSGLGGASRIA